MYCQQFFQHLLNKNLSIYAIKLYLQGLKYSSLLFLVSTFTLLNIISLLSAPQVSLILTKLI